MVNKFNIMTHRYKSHKIDILYQIVAAMFIYLHHKNKFSHETAIAWVYPIFGIMEVTLTKRSVKKFFIMGRFTLTLKMI